MKYVLFLMMVLFSNQAVALDCSKQPTCAELNYSKEDNPKCDKNGYILCPYDQSYKKCIRYNCETLGFTQSDKSSWCGKISKCPNDESYTACKALCEIGDVYYADGTCGYAEDYDASSGKIPAGVVFYVNDAGTHGKVIALKNVTPDKDYTFLPPSKNNPRRDNGIPMGCPYYNNFHSHEQLISALRNGDPAVYDGKANTKAFLDTQDFRLCNGKSKDDPDYPYYCQATGAILTNKFYPDGVLETNPKVGAGNWYIPAIGEILQMSPVDVSRMTSCAPNSTDGATNKSYNIIKKTFESLIAQGVPAALPSAYMPSSNNVGYGTMYFGAMFGGRSQDACSDAHPIRAILAF